MKYASVLLITLTALAIAASAAAPAPPPNSLLPPSYIYVRYQKPTPETPYTVVEVVAVVMGDEGAEVRFVGDLNIYDEHGNLIHGECLNSRLVRGGETVIARYVVPPEHSGEWLTIQVIGAFRAGKCVYRVGYEDTVWAPPSYGINGETLTAAI